MRRGGGGIKNYRISWASFGISGLCRVQNKLFAKYKRALEIWGKEKFIRFDTQASIKEAFRSCSS